MVRSISWTPASSPQTNIEAIRCHSAVLPRAALALFDGPFEVAVEVVCAGKYPRADEFAPAIFRQVDHGPVARIALSAKAPTVPVTVAAGHHFVRFWIATHSLYLTSAAGQQT